MLKIKELGEDTSLKNNVDIVAVIVEIGEMKLATHTLKRPVPAREIYLCDDSWTMIKLIARDFFAEHYIANFKSNQIIYIKNARPIKLRNPHGNYLVLATVPGTLLSHEVNTLEAIRLKFWLDEHCFDFRQCGLKDIALKRFTNLSSSDENSSADYSQMEFQSLQFAQSVINPVNQINGVEENKNVVNDNGKSERKRIRDEECVNMKLIKIDLTKDTAMVNGSTNVSASISDSATQKVNSDSSKKITAAINNEIIVNIGSDDESIERTIKKEVLEKEKSDTEVIDEEEDFIVCETYCTLMSDPKPLDKWNTEKDKYLINFLSKHCTKQLTDDVYLKLHQANLNIFQDISIDEIKTRVEFLACATNYIYLLQLCGGKEIKSEKEKCVFVDRVEQLRRVMRGKKI